MPEFSELVERIRLDRLSGAAELAIQAAQAVERVAGSPGFSETARLEAVRALVRAQPAMAPLVNLANRVLSAPLGGTAEVCRSFAEELRGAGEAVGAVAAGCIADGMTVLTHSSSSTVLEALARAKRSGRNFEVICTESRPLCEGVGMARRLAGEGIPVRLIVDAAAYSMLPATRLVLVGADSVSSRGLLNKAGTAALALAAKTLGVEVYALAGTAKFLPAAYHPPEQELRDPTEILEKPLERVTPINYYFDLTPLSYLSGVITEDGILAPGAVASRLAALPLHPALLTAAP